MRKIVCSCLLLAGYAHGAAAAVTTTATVERSFFTLADPESGATTSSSAQNYNGGGTSGCRCGMTSSSGADAGAGSLFVDTTASGGYGGDKGTASASARIVSDLSFAAIDPSKTSTVVFTLSDLTSAANSLMPNQSLVLSLSGGFGTQSFVQRGSSTQDYAFSFTGPASVHIDLLLQGGSSYGALNSDFLKSNATIALRTTNASFGSTGGFLTSAVPEPASWAMMIGGFGLVGAAIRRRAAATAVA